MTSARALALASHPGPTAVVTALAGALALGVGVPTLTAVLVTAAVFAGQLSIGWSNDWIDAERDRAAARRDKPAVTGGVSPARLRTAALVAAAVCVPLSLAVGWQAGLAHVVAVAGGWAYNASLKAGPWSWLPYAVSFGLLPVFVVLALPGAPRPLAWVVVAGSLLGVGAHLANAVPDLEEDAAHGIRGLPHRLGRRWTSILAPMVLMAAVVVIVVGQGALVMVGDSGMGPGVVLGAGTAIGLAVAAGVVAAVRPSSRVPFALTMAVAVVCVVLLVGAGEGIVSGWPTGAGS